MKAISTGGTFEIFDDSLKAYNKLPAQTYIVRFSKSRGFFLEKYSEFEFNDGKIYGVHNEKVNKVLDSFNKFTRNLGVILSGDKGIGKSLFAKLLAIQAVKNGIPVIVIDSYIPGIASYLEYIDQEVMILFDEFDKTFGGVKQSDGDTDPQVQLLSLFDGMSSGKKLFVITCNKVDRLNEYLVNRPGRFHYHFRFNYPTAEEVREYMQDKIPEERYDEIESVVAFSKRINLNYDCLRAIAFEISQGVSVREAIKDLNIVNTEDSIYSATLHFENGYTMRDSYKRFNMFDSDEEKIWFYLSDNTGSQFLDVGVFVSSFKYDPETGRNIVDVSDMTLEYDNDFDDKVKIAKEAKPKYLVLEKYKPKDIHYSI